MGSSLLFVKGTGSFEHASEQRKMYDAFFTTKGVGMGAAGQLVYMPSP